LAPKLNIGIRIPAIHPVDVAALRPFVLRAEELGFHSIWVGDHVYHHVDVLQPLHLLTWVAALTEKARLGTAVMLTSYLNPVLLAKAAASLDVLSGGRLTLGISIGGTPAEYRSIGVPQDQRVGRLLENVRIMRRLWQEDGVDYEGRYNQIEGGSIRPKPVQQPGIPLYFGANGEAMLRRAGRHADGYVGSSSALISTFLHNADVFRQAAREAGRDPDTLGLAKLHGVSVHSDHDKARELAATQWQTYYSPRFDVDQFTCYGTPDEVRQQLREFATSDAPEITLVLEPPTLGLEELDLLWEATRGLT
jgi:probable F420-dependent oxidoreductase